MIIATAGHVDHGKSTLVRALTGVEPDRWDEEHRRGLTIDLGFAPLALHEGRRAAFVDVPGHERFASNMLAGCATVDLALFVVSAREGWQAQSEEHLWILDLLGMRAGVVALSHADAVTAGQADAVEAAVRSRLAATFLQDAPIVRTSLDDAASTAALRDALDAVVAGLAPRHETGRARLWIDRSFTVAGAGRVVTGGLEGGTLSVGDEVVVVGAPRERRGDATSQPSVSPGRVRGLHTFGEPVEYAGPGQRVACNLTHLRAAPARGAAVVHAATWEGGPFAAARRLDVALRARNGRWPRERGEYQLVVGTTHVPVQVRWAPVGRAADSERPARLHARRAVGPLSPGDRFVLRDPGARAVVASGTILAMDPLARRSGPNVRQLDGARGAPRDRTDELDAWAAKAREAIEADPPLLPRAAARQRAGLSSQQVSELVHAQRLVAIGENVTTPERFEALGAQVRARLAGGPATTSELRRALGWSRRTTVALLEALDARGITERRGDTRTLRNAP